MKSILSEFYCPLNIDVESFLKNKAIEFGKQGISITQLIFKSYKDRPVLVGYFTLANKQITIDEKKLSKSQRKRIHKFGVQDSVTKRTIIPMPLIAQLGKNYFNEYNNLINGGDLLQIAIDQAAEAQRIIGGRFIYLECEDIPRLIEFYKRNGFKSFGARDLDPDELDTFKSKRLIQMLRHI